MELLLNTILPTLLYIAAIVLIVVLIVVACKLVTSLNKINALVDNIEGKVNTLNGAFDVVEKASNGLANITDSFVGAVTGLIARIFGKSKNNHLEEDDDNE